MDYVHIRNLEKFHPGYKDRKLQWAKIFFNMVQGDPDCEMIDEEIDWCRLIKLIILELQAQKPIPLDSKYLSKKGFDLKKRPIALTLNMLHNFVDVVHEESKMRVLEKEKEKEKEKSKSYSVLEQHTVTEWNSFCNTKPMLSKVKEISGKRRTKLKQRFLEPTFLTFKEILAAIAEQPFCLGKNDRNWKVSFDWLIDNDTNYLKVLERKYSNANEQNIPSGLQGYIRKK